MLRKRSVEQQPWSCRAKRVCLEFQSSECPMETNHGFIGANQQEEQQTQVAVVRPRPLLSCPRCLGGEPLHWPCVRVWAGPKACVWVSGNSAKEMRSRLDQTQTEQGHINHIMGH